jgi:uncharacterized repeat protein (TIGR03803 family)
VNIMQQSIHRFIFSFVTAMIVALTLSTPQAKGQTEKIIYSFTGSTDGTSPQGGVVLDTKGNLYGVTESGGANGGGTVFELSPGGGAWTKTVLYSFTFSTSDVALPTSNLVFDAKGNLYGMAPLGGTNGAGGIFELSPGSNGMWSEKIIYSFTGGTDIVTFESGLTIDSGSNLYGYLGSAVLSDGNSTFGGVFELESGPNGTWTEKVLHTFSGGSDGIAPYGGMLAVDSVGDVFGMASGGSDEYGVAFELVRRATGSWNDKILHIYKGGADGSYGYGGPMAIDRSGNVFGTSTWSVIEFVPGSNGTWTEKILHNFAGPHDGIYPDAGVTLSNSGKIYGTTNQGGAHYGTVFELVPSSSGTWNERILHRFMPSSGDGYYPSLSPVVVDGQGNVYGSLSSGGISNNGVVFEVTP